MKLSPALVIKELSHQYKVVANTPLPIEPILSRPVIPEQGVLPPKGSLCIIPKGEHWESSHLEAGLLLTTEGTAPKDGEVLVHAPSTAALYNSLQRIFDRYDSWSNDLMESRLQGQSVQTLLELTYQLLGIPMVVIGMDFSIIASIEGDAYGMGRGVYGSTDDTYDNLTTLKHNGLYERIRELDGWFPFRSEGKLGECICVNIKKFKKTMYRLIAFQVNMEEDKAAAFLMEHLATMIEHALLHNISPTQGEGHILHTILHTAISDRTADYVTISQQLETCGWLSNHEYLCIVLKLSYLDQKNLTLHAICNYIENIIKDSCAFQFKEDIVVYINLTLSSLDRNNISSRIGCFVRDSLLQAGYSRTMLGHFNFRRQYDQAKIALDLGSRKNPSFWVHRFNDIAFDYILHQATRKLPGYMLSHEQLLQLKYSDDENGTEYLHTLQVYLNNHLNAVQTARDLYIHRSTFLYRLERIKAILGSDLTDPDEILYLMLSFRLMAQESHS